MSSMKKSSTSASSPPSCADPRMLCSPNLFMFLCGAHSKEGNHSPLRILEGQGDVLRIIFQMACEEWWNAHITIFPDSVPHLLPWPRPHSRDDPNDEPDMDYPLERQDVSGCPVAVVHQGVPFPPPATVPLGTFENQSSESLYVNMMPIAASSKKDVLMASLPPCCHQYAKLIRYCLKRLSPEDKKGVIFLTIDERPVQRGESQRRGGVHVESPGILPLLPPGEQHRTSGKDDDHATIGTNGVFIPGAEHHWGRGMMMRKEKISGGIFMASNVSDSCAVWNCHVHDPRGDIVGSHGDVRRLAPLLGPPSLLLAAGDLVWMTDKTPHESMPLRQDTCRQYFRLVTGEVTSWFADHSTPNPMWTTAEHAEHLKNVNVVRGNKFERYHEVQCCKWNLASAEELTAAQELKDLRDALNTNGLGCMGQMLFDHGICSIAQLLKASEAQGSFFKRVLADVGQDWLRGVWYYEERNLYNMLRELRVQAAKEQDTATNTNAKDGYDGCN